MTWDETTLHFSIEGNIVNDHPRHLCHGTSWIFVAEAIEVQFDVLTLGQPTTTRHSMKQCKPNNDIVLGHDDDIPHDLYYRDETRVAGRAIPPPNWNEDYTLLRSAAYNDAVRRGYGDHLWVYLRTWFLCHDDLPLTSHVF